MIRLVLAASLFAAAAAAAAVPARADGLRRTEITDDAIDKAPVVAPEGEPKAIVAIVSDSDGWTPARGAEADALATEGALVIGVDLPRYIAGVGRGAEACVFLSGDIEELARLAGKTLGVTRYRLPVVLGVGAGGDIAYAMLSQAPPNMLSGAVSLGFTGRAPLAKPLCDGPKTMSRDGASLVMGADPENGLQGEWRVLVPKPADPKVAVFAAALPEADVVELGAGDDPASAAREAALDIGGGDPDAVKSLPLALYPPKGGAPWGLAVIYSGDGGWRDLDKTIGEALQAAGYGVVGVDTLRYFWNEKSPRELADDLEAIVGRYGAEWRTTRTLLAGYSFGADVIPFAWSRLSRQVRDQIRLVALLGLSKTADFQVSVSGWLGVGSGSHDVLKAAAGLPMDRVMCVYGAEEVAGGDAACAGDPFPPSARVEMPGDHHFGGDYAGLARRIDDAFGKDAAGRASE